MPTTYNGIGTHYYGKKNATSRQGRCNHCGATTRLDSHETRLWFVVVFIPVIPLGKKRIMDMCSRCNWHYVTPLKQWEEMQQLGISSAKAEYEADPVVEKAIHYHQTLLNFHEHEAAKVFREEMRQRYEMSALMHGYLGETLLEQGAMAESDAAFRRAFELKPDLPAARMGMSQIHLRAGELDAARKMLDFMEQPGAEELGNLGPLEVLAIAFQNAGRHKEALELFKRLQVAYPDIAKVPGFRKLVQKSEKDLPGLERHSSLLPRMSLWERLKVGNTKKWALGGGIAALVVAAAVGQNQYVKAHREVHVVNGWPAALSVSVDGGTAKEVAAGGHAVVELAEGVHQVRYAGGFSGEEQVEFRSGFFERWGDEMLVMNPGGRAILVKTHASYSRNPSPPVIRMHGGLGFERIERVTHPFKELPETVSMKSSEKERVLTSVNLFPGKASSVLGYYLSQNETSEALAMAEQLLPAWNDEENLLLMLTAIALPSRQAPRVAAMLQPYLSRRPVNVALHRCYQDMIRLHEGDAKGREKLQSEYEALLAADAGNSGLLYLVTRVIDDEAREESLLEQALKADQSNVWAHYSIGSRLSTKARWSEALPHLAAAYMTRRDNIQFEHALFTARMALRDYDALTKDLEAILQQNATHPTYAAMLAEVLVAKNDTTRLLGLAASFEKYSGRTPEGMASNARFKAKTLLLQGDHEAAFRIAYASQDEKRLQLELEVLRGRLQEALAMPLAATEAKTDSEFSLAMALAFEMRGERRTANEWIKLTQGSYMHEPEKKALEELAATENPDPKVLAGKNFTVTQGSLIAAIMSFRGETNREAFRAYAKDRNVRLTFPAALIEKALQKAP